MSSMNPSRLDRKFLFDGAQAELDGIPLEAVDAGPQVYNATLEETITAGDSASATGGDRTSSADCSTWPGR